MVHNAVSNWQYRIETYTLCRQYYAYRYGSTGYLSGYSPGLVIARSRVRVPAGAAEKLSSPGSTFCADSFQYPFHPCVTTVALNTSGSFCQKYRWQVSYTRMHAAYAVVVEVLFYVHRNRRFIRDGSPGRPHRLSHSSWALVSMRLRIKWQCVNWCMVVWSTRNVRQETAVQHGFSHFFILFFIFLYWITYEKSAMNLLDSGEYRYIKVMYNNNRQEQ